MNVHQPLSARAGFERTLVTHLDHLNRFAMSLCGRRAAAEDLAQTTMMRAIDKWESFTPDTNMRAWLFTIMRNEFYSQIRKRKHEVEDADGAMAERFLVIPAGQEDTIDIVHIREAFAGLSKIQRRAILLLASGLSYEEAAAQENTSVGTMKSRVHRGRAILSGRLRPLGFDFSTRHEAGEKVKIAKPVQPRYPKGERPLADYGLFKQAPELLHAHTAHGIVKVGELQEHLRANGFARTAETTLYNHLRQFLRKGLSDRQPLFPPNLPSTVARHVGLAPHEAYREILKTLSPDLQFFWSGIWLREKTGVPQSHVERSAPMRTEVVEPPVTQSKIYAHEGKRLDIYAFFDSIQEIRDAYARRGVTTSGDLLEALRDLYPEPHRSALSAASIGKFINAGMMMGAPARGMPESLPALIALGAGLTCDAYATALGNMDKADRAAWKKIFAASEKELTGLTTGSAMPASPHKAAPAAAAASAGI
ncbi:MAG: sigma-70 family RNA polymerase sigma factor [Alphaproteobacteria bacterium]|nr:sigma-70 family RNA polymerase sigma factor [Alphaproteobacteria bacterium]